MRRSSRRSPTCSLRSSGLERDKIKPEATFEEDLQVDSLGVVEVLMAIEDNFDVKIPDEEAESITTVGQAIDVIETKLG